MGMWSKLLIAALVISMAGFAGFKLSRPSFDTRFQELLNYEAQNRLYA